VLFAVAVGSFAGLLYRKKYIAKGNERITMDHIFNGTFAAEQYSLNWVPEGVLTATGGADSQFDTFHLI